MEQIRVWANGCFDVFHFGHANFLRQAKSMGDYLIAGIHGDEDIAKNKAYPVISEKERARIISAVKWVDEIKDDIPYGDVLKTLDENSCHFCVHGDDIAKDANGCDIYMECKENGRFKECKRTEGISTTMIIDRILLAAGGKTYNGYLDRPRAIENGLQPRAQNVSPGKHFEMSEEYYEEKINQFSSNTGNPKEDDKIIYTQGVFDLFHSGHVDFLELSKNSVPNSFLVVGVLSDEEFYKLYGAYPVTNSYERALALLSCKFVDRVKIGVPFEITSKFLDDLKVNPGYYDNNFENNVIVQVDLVYHRKQWELPYEPYTVAKERRIFHVLDSGNNTTTQMIIQRVIDSKDMYYERNLRKPESQLSVNEF